MNNLKKALALVMSMALAASTLVAGAASYDDVPATHTNAQAISLLGDLGVMVGDAGTGDFRPDGTLKRSEAAAIVYRLRTGKTNAENFAGAASEMTDIEGHWAAGYIKYCEAESIISGYPDKTFRPDQEVTYAEFTTMLVRALNLQEVKEVSTIVDGVINTEKVVTTTFPNGYIAIADKQGINDKVSLSTNEPADRASVAQMAYNAIFEADYLKTIGERDNIYTLSEEVFKLTKVSDTIVTAVGDVKCVSASAADTDEVTFDSAVGTEKNVESGHSLSGSYEFAVDPALVGQQVDVYYKNKDGKKTIMAVVPADGNIVTTVNAADIDVDGTTIKYVNAEGKTKKLERDFTLGKLMVNGEYVDYTQLSGANMTDIVKLLDANVPMTVTIVDNADGANDVDVLKVDVYATAEISAVESKAIYLTAQAENIMTTANSSYSALYKTLADRAINTATKIELYDDDDERKKEVEIYDGIAAEDKVVIYYGAGDAVKIMKAEKQSGTLSQIDDDVYTIGGKDYKLMEGYEALTSASVGKAIDFRVDPVYGYLYWSDKTAADVSDYYYVASVGVDSGVEGTTYKAVVYNYKGEKIVMEVKNATVAEKLNGTLAEKLNGTFVDTTGGGEEGNEPDGVDDEIVVTQAYHKVL
ncbi:MAG: S-layer homology domain-containing protein, partial [Eubacteriales bacterium]